MSQPDYYTILNVSRDASEDKIRKAYRQLALKYHPDKNPSDKRAETKFREAKDAYELLCNVLERRRYDQHNPPEPGQDLEYNLEVALKNGTDGSWVPVEEITFEIEGRKIRLLLDKGDGRYRLRGAGGAGAYGGAPGDLFVIVNAKARELDVPQTILRNDGTEMVLIPAGEFLMGSNDADARDDEKPVHTVYLDAFYMDKHAVTISEYKQFVRATGHRVLPDWVSKISPTDQHPVVGVSWHDAMAYTQWAEKRLPTEAEWEKAARGGLVGKRYPWGDSIDTSKANYSASNFGGTKTVGSYAANNYGLYDMAGNVFEWYLDAYNSFDQRNPVSGDGIAGIINNFENVDNCRVLRGGSWGYIPATYVRVACRYFDSPANTSAYYGFRCVRAVTP
ncbi:MAG: SUMF1/EgtB/PvdO family nonheme iron enzyme [Candidatus Poribacteria bacterium]|nr:SUMF1/EgtB/PvdO family nonheme iron enzyme [Candidatus Poribacteria bacterium]